MKRLWKILLALVLVGCLLTACGDGGEPAGQDDSNSGDEGGSQGGALELPVVLENDTGVDIYALHCSPTGTESWGGDLLSAPLAAGDSMNLVFTIADSDGLKWDLRMQDNEGNYVPLYGLDFTDCSTAGGTIVLEFDADGGVGYATLYSD